MLRIRTMYGDSLKFSAENLSFAYGLNGNTSYTEYGYAKGYTGTATFSGASYYYLSSAGANQTNSATINFVTTNANQKVSFYIGSQSEANYDFMCLGNLDSDSINKCAALISGNPGITTHTFTVATAGAHYVKLFYKKDRSTNTGNDRGYFRMVPYVNQKSTLNVDTESIRIEARKTWSVTSKPNWITLNVSSGVKGVTDVIVTSTVNTSSSTRNGNIVIKDSAGKEYTLVVSQTAAVNSVDITREGFYETYASGSDTFTVGLNGNTSWSVASYSGSSNFFTISPTGGTSSTTATVTWQQNTSSTSRQCKVTIKGNLGGTDTINIYQEGRYCSCNCEGFCTCDCDSYCLDASLDCDGETFCGCYGQTSCTCDSKDNCACYSQTNCSCDGQTNCNCHGYDYCTCDSKTNCTCYSKDTCSKCTCDCEVDGCVINCPSDYDCTCDCNSQGGCNCNCNINGCSCNCDQDAVCSCDCHRDYNTTCDCYGKSIYCTCDDKLVCVCESREVCNCYGKQGCSCMGEQVCICYGQTTACTDCTTDLCLRDGCPGDGCRIDKPIICSELQTGFQMSLKEIQESNDEDDAAVLGITCIAVTCTCDCNRDNFSICEKVTWNGCTCDCNNDEVCQCDCNRDEICTINTCPSHEKCNCDCNNDDYCTSYCDCDGQTNCFCYSKDTCNCDSQTHCSCKNQEWCYCDDQWSCACNGETNCSSHCTCDCDSDGFCNCNCNWNGCTCDCDQQGACTCNCDDQYKCTCDCQSQGGCSCNCDVNGCTCNCESQGGCDCDCNSYCTTDYCYDCASKDTCVCNGYVKPTVGV